METTRTVSADAAISRVRGMILFAAFASFLFSVYLWFTGQREEGLFVGIWVPSILALGCLMMIGRRRA